MNPAKKVWTNNINIKKQTAHQNTPYPSCVWVTEKNKENGSKVKDSILNT